MSTDASTTATATASPSEHELSTTLPPPPLPPASSLKHSNGETESVDSDHSGHSDGSDGSDGSDSYETVDLAESELYQVLSLFLSRTPKEGADENTPTENVTDVLAGLRSSVEKLNGLLQTLVSATQATASSTSGQGSSSSSSHRRHRVKSSTH